MRNFNYPQIIRNNDYRQNKLHASHSNNDLYHSKNNYIPFDRQQLSKPIGVQYNGLSKIFQNKGEFRGKKSVLKLQNINLDALQQKKTMHQKAQQDNKSLIQYRKHLKEEQLKKQLQAQRKLQQKHKKELQQLQIKNIEQIQSDRNKLQVNKRKQIFTNNLVKLPKNTPMIDFETQFHHILQEQKQMNNSHKISTPGLNYSTIIHKQDQRSNMNYLQSKQRKTRKAKNQFSNELIQQKYIKQSLKYPVYSDHEVKHLEQTVCKLQQQRNQYIQNQNFRARQLKQKNKLIDILLGQNMQNYSYKLKNFSYVQPNYKIKQTYQNLQYADIDLLSKLQTNNQLQCYSNFTTPKQKNHQRNLLSKQY